MLRHTSPAARKTEQILDAALAQADVEGWPGLAVLPVARRAGLAPGTVTARFGQRTGLAVALWRQRLASSVDAAVIALLEACPSRGAAPDAEQLLAALSVFARPNETMRAAAELLIVARHQPPVAAAVGESLGAVLTEALTPRRGHLSRAQAGRHGYLVLLALGLLIESRGHPGEFFDLSHEVDLLAGALAASPHLAGLPAETAAHLDEPAVFNTGEEAWDALLQAMLDEVATHGYDGATVERVAAACGYSQGLIFRRYPTKRDMFLDVTNRMYANATELNEAYVRGLTETHSPGIAEAAHMREHMLPGRQPLYTANLEQVRLSWRDGEMRAVMEAGIQDTISRLAEEDTTRTPEQLETWIHIQIALGYGVSLLAGLYEPAWQLPYHVVTIPLIDEAE